MIKMCDLPRYADADMEEIKKMKEAHTVLNRLHMSQSRCIMDIRISVFESM